MPSPTAAPTGDVYDATTDFVYAVSLLAAMEGATGHKGHTVVLPFLGMPAPSSPTSANDVPLTTSTSRFTTCTRAWSTSRSG